MHQRPTAPPPLLYAMPRTDIDTRCLLHGPQGKLSITVCWSGNGTEVTPSSRNVLGAKVGAGRSLAIGWVVCSGARPLLSLPVRVLIWSPSLPPSTPPVCRFGHPERAPNPAPTPAPAARSTP